jgi:hypothetical protein
MLLSVTSETDLPRVVTMLLLLLLLPLILNIMSEPMLNPRFFSSCRRLSALYQSSTFYRNMQNEIEEEQEQELARYVG